MDNPNKSYSTEMKKSFCDEDWMQNPLYNELLLNVQKGFTGKNVETESFAYLLLDPRISKNQRARTFRAEEPFGVRWASFIDSIYYVGKGRGSRGYHHFKDALKEYKKGQKTSHTPKIKYILDIWYANYGALILHIFDDMASDEAHTYEAAIIDAIGLKNLSNEKGGTYYGIAKNFTSQEKNMLGMTLLWRAFNINIRDGERQIRPENI